MEWPSLGECIAIGVVLVVGSFITGAIDTWWEQRKRKKELESTKQGDLKT